MITALRMASQAAKEVWWKVILKESATVAIKGTAAETSKKVLDKMNINKRPIKKKLKTLEKMLSKKELTKEEYDKLRKRIIDECSIQDI